MYFIFKSYVYLFFNCQRYHYNFNSRIIFLDFFCYLVKETAHIFKALEWCKSLQWFHIFMGSRKQQQAHKTDTTNYAEEKS